MVVRTSTCSYRSEMWPPAHSCLRHDGHPGRHRCWCGDSHSAPDSGCGRWEDYITPELKEGVLKALTSGRE